MSPPPASNLVLDETGDSLPLEPPHEPTSIPSHLIPFPTTKSLLATPPTTDPLPLASDIARAALSKSEPLWGRDTVCANLAESLLHCGDDRALSGSRIHLVLSAAQHAPKLKLVDGVFRELCRVCLVSRCERAGRHACALSVAAWGAVTAAERMRFLVYDVLYSLAKVDDVHCLLIVYAVQSCFSGDGDGEGFVLEAGAEEGSQGSAVLYLSVCRSLAALLARLEGLWDAEVDEEKRSAVSDALTGMSDALAGLGLGPVEDLEGDASNGKLWTQALRASRSVTSPDDALCGRLALALEARRLGPSEAYSQLLTTYVWPAVADCLVVKNGSDHLPPRLRHVCAAELSASILAVGSVLAALEQFSDGAFVQRGVAEVRQRLLRLLRCEEVPVKAQAAAARCLVLAMVGERKCVYPLNESSTFSVAEGEAILRAILVWKTKSGLKNIDFCGDKETVTCLMHLTGQVRK